MKTVTIKKQGTDKNGNCWLLVTYAEGKFIHESFVHVTDLEDFEEGLEIEVPKSLLK